MTYAVSSALPRIESSSVARRGTSSSTTIGTRPITDAELRASALVVMTAASLASSTMNRRRSVGNAGSSGTYAVPAASVPTIDGTMSRPRSTSSPTRSPRRAPVARELRRDRARAIRELAIRHAAAAARDRDAIGHAPRGFEDQLLDAPRARILELGAVPDRQLAPIVARAAAAACRSSGRDRRPPRAASPRTRRASV